MKVNTPKDWPTDAEITLTDLINQIQTNIEEIIIDLQLKEGSQLYQIIQEEKYDYIYLRRGSTHHNIKDTRPVLVLNKMVT